MAINFKTLGPFPLYRQGGVDLDKLDTFWGEIDGGLCDASGVYIFCTQHGSSALKPWYVGQTHTRFESRFRQHERADTFGKIAQASPNDPLQVFLIARTTASGGFKRSTKRKTKAIEELEFALIGACLSTNKKLLNVSESKFFGGFNVPGFRDQRPGKPNQSARALSSMLKLS